MIREIRMLIADDHEDFRDRFRSILTNRPGWKVVGESGSGLTAIESAREFTPDLIFMDISMPELDGLEAAQLIHTELPQIKIIFLTVHESKEYAEKARQIGAMGYVLKRNVTRDLTDAVETAMKGGFFRSREIL